LGRKLSEVFPAFNSNLTWSPQSPGEGATTKQHGWLPEFFFNLLHQLNSTAGTLRMVILLATVSAFIFLVTMKYYTHPILPECKVEQ
jgi:hypothetical protein